MIDLLAQSVAPVVSDALTQSSAGSRPFGLLVEEWVILIGALTTLIPVLAKAIRGGKKLQAVIEAVEETHQQHPAAGKLVKRLARDKATKLGVEVNKLWDAGLEADVERITDRLKKPRKDSSENPSA